MLPEQPALMKGAGRERALLAGGLRATRRAGALGRRGGLALDRGRPSPSPPDEDDLFRALDTGLGNTPGRERYLRVRAWWAANDPVRGQAGEPQDDFWSGRRLANLRALTVLLSRAPGRETDAGLAFADRLMGAEVARPLGEFERARQELAASPFPPGLDAAAARIAAGAAAGERGVREMVFAPTPPTRGR